MKKKTFDKYYYYKKAVQSPNEDVKFFDNVFTKINKSKARSLREDFCGTFSISLAWVQAHEKNKAIAVDIDPKPLAYGTKNYLPKLTKDEQSRIQILNKNVLTPSLPKADIISVSNFSHYILKEKKNLLKYFKNIHRQLPKKGLFVIDAVGGPDCQENLDEIVEFKDFTYYWEQKNFNPINNVGKFYIHFKRKGERKRKNVFSYHWRLWSLPELQDTLKDAGFSTVEVYWEVPKKNGSGSGVFKKSSTGQACACWIAYIVARK